MAETIWGLTSFLFIAFWLGTLYDVIHWRAEVWDRARESRVLWLVVVFLLGPLGAGFYWAAPRLKLKHVRRIDLSAN